MSNDIVEDLRTRAKIRLTAKGRKSVEEGKPDRLAALLLDAANEIERLRLLQGYTEFVLKSRVDSRY